MKKVAIIAEQDSSSQDLYETLADANRRVHCFRTIKMLYELYLREVNTLLLLLYYRYRSQKVLEP